ncbi:hypothetical protein J5893_02355 [bacterium]|nr:hypothetical protein [bacterium]
MPEKLVQMPTDDELVHFLIDAVNEGAHDNIKGYMKQLTGFMEKAKGVIKMILNFDAQTGVKLNLTMGTADQALEGMVNAQSLVVKGILTGLLAMLADGSFHGFVQKMKDRNDDSVEVTINTSTRILTLFMDKIGVTYVVATSPDEVRAMVEHLFV